MASVGGKVRVQGTVTGIRRVFTASVAGTAVAADRADVLAALLGARLDERRLALHLLHPHLLHPLAGLPGLVRGVDVLPGDSYVLLADGRARTVRWWSPPEPELPLAEGAARLREAMTAAVDLRVAGRDLVSCDLGGLDSTAVCALAARRGGTVAAYTAASPDPLAERRPVGRPHGRGAAGGRAPRRAGRGDAAGLRRPRPRRRPLDEPCSATVDRERWLVLGRRAAARGSGT